MTKIERIFSEDWLCQCGHTKGWHSVVGFCTKCNCEKFKKYDITKSKKLLD